MKKLIFVFILSLVSLNVFSITIKLSSDQKIYKLPHPTLNMQYKQYVDGKFSEKSHVDFKSNWNIIKFGNYGTTLDVYYDGIFVKPKSKLYNGTYFIKYEDIPNEYKHFVDSANSLISLKYKEDFDNKIQKLNSEIDSFYNVINSINDNYNIQLPNITKIYNDTLTKLQKEHVNEIDSIKLSLYNKISKQGKELLSRIHINRSELSYANSAGGHDIIFYYTNLNKKSIKYLNFNCDFYNKVDDKVYCEIRDNNIGSCKDTGPIEYNQKDGGYWENMIYNYSASYYIITYIKITYMDNTTYSVSLSKKDFLNIIKYCEFINNELTYKTSISGIIDNMRNERDYKLDGLNRTRKTTINNVNNEIDKLKNEINNINKEKEKTYYEFNLNENDEIVLINKFKLEK